MEFGYFQRIFCTFRTITHANFIGRFILGFKFKSSSLIVRLQLNSINMESFVKSHLNER